MKLAKHPSGKLRNQIKRTNRFSPWKFKKFPGRKLLLMWNCWKPHLLTKNTPLLLKIEGQSVWVTRCPEKFWLMTSSCGYPRSMKFVMKVRCSSDTTIRAHLSGFNLKPAKINVTRWKIQIWARNCSVPASLIKYALYPVFEKNDIRFASLTVRFYYSASRGRKT